MSQVRSELAPERRELLARKGQILYGKFCGTKGRGICAEPFAIHQLWLGNVEVVEDLLAFLDDQLRILRTEDPDGRLAMTEELVDRVRGHIEHEA